MMDFFDSLANAREDEIEGLVALESAEIAAEKACLAYNYARDLQDLRNAEAELKWYAESGDADDLIGYYEAAKTVEAEQKTEGLLKKAWMAIKNLFEKIKNAIFKKKIEPPKDPKAKVRVPKPFALIVKKLKSAWNAVKSAVISGKKKLTENGNWKKLLLVLGIVGIAGAGVAAATHKKTTYSKLEDTPALSGPAKQGQIEGKNTPLLEAKERPPKIDTKNTAEVTVAEIIDTNGVVIDMTETIIKVSDAATKNPGSQDAENADAVKVIAPVVRQIGQQCRTYAALPDKSNERLGLPDKKTIYMGGPTNNVIEMGGPTSKVIPMGGPVEKSKTPSEALQKMGNEKLKRLIQRGIVKQGGHGEWNRVKGAWKNINKKNQGHAREKVMQLYKGGYLTEEEIFAMESVSDEYFLLDMDGFMESNYGESAGYYEEDFDEDFFENL